VTETRRLELAALLRSRRERLQPADVGLPTGERRRTRGLRREEVALLAHLSPAYYTFLEQGRDVHPSRQVLDALARALCLDETERGLLHTLTVPVSVPHGEESLADGIDDLVQRQDPFPAYVTGRCWDVLSANWTARVLFTDWSSAPPEERNLLWFMFVDPYARVVYREWELEAAAQLARFRAAPPSDARTAFAERLLAASPEARAWWPRHDVRRLSGGSKLLYHPAIGEVRIRHVVLTVADAPDQKLVTFERDLSVLLSA